MATRPDLTDEAVRLQVLLERVKAGEDELIDAFLREEASLLSRRLRESNLTAAQTARIEALLVTIRQALEALHGRYRADLLARIAELGEAMAEAEAITLALGHLEATVPLPQTLRAAVLSSPLGVRGAGGGLLLEAFIAGWSAADIERVTGVIRRGFFEGQTTEQIVRAIVGTKANRYRDGILDVSRRNARTVVHTSLQHVATVARVETMKANGGVVKGYRWVSTLDNRTGALCRSLDGRIFEFGQGPLPPAHPNCRSTIVPVTRTWRELGIDLDEMPRGTRASMHGQVPGHLTYYEWLKTQPASFVEEALGPDRAALFLKGGLEADEFARLQLDRNFRPLTLEELRKLIPEVFKRAGV